MEGGGLESNISLDPLPLAPGLNFLWFSVLRLLGLRVLGVLGFEGLGFRVQDSEFGLWGLGFRIPSLRFGVSHPANYP